MSKPVPPYGTRVTESGITAWDDVWTPLPNPNRIGEFDRPKQYAQAQNCAKYALEILAYTQPDVGDFDEPLAPTNGEYDLKGKLHIIKTGTLLTIALNIDGERVLVFRGCYETQYGWGNPSVFRQGKWMTYLMHQARSIKSRHPRKNFLPVEDDELFGA